MECKNCFYFPCTKEKCNINNYDCEDGENFYQKISEQLNERNDN